MLYPLQSSIVGNALCDGASEPCLTPTPVYGPRQPMPRKLWGLMVQCNPAFVGHVQVSKLFDDAALACVCLCGAHMFWLKSCVPDAMAFMTHNYVFPRGIGAVDWCLLPEMKQVLVYDHLHEDMRCACWSLPADLASIRLSCRIANARLFCAAVSGSSMRDPETACSPACLHTLSRTCQLAGRGALAVALPLLWSEWASIV